MNHTIQVQTSDGIFHTILSEVSKGFAEGYLRCYRNSPSPRLALRILKGDKVVDSVPEHREVHIGQIAGWPTAAQYRDAAARAILKAEQIEAFEQRQTRLSSNETKTSQSA
jgi:hypothetical protein